MFERKTNCRNCGQEIEMRRYGWMHVKLVPEPNKKWEKQSEPDESGEVCTDPETKEDE